MFRVDAAKLPAQRVRRGIADVARASQRGTLLGSMSQRHAVPAALENAFYDVITAHFNGERDSATAVLELARALELAK